MIEAWKNGFVPLQKNAIGYFVERVGLRSGGSSFVPCNGLKPESECKGTIKNIFSQYGRAISRRKEKTIKIYAHVHTTDDTYLKVDGITHYWAFKEKEKEEFAEGFLLTTLFGEEKQ